MTDKERTKAFAQLIDSVQSPPANNVQALGHLMREWLQGICDSGTCVDSGAGLGAYDLWVKFGGQTVYINLKLSGATP